MVSTARLLYTAKGVNRPAYSGLINKWSLFQVDLKTGFTVECMNKSLKSGTPPVHIGRAAYCGPSANLVSIGSQALQILNLLNWKCMGNACLVIMCSIMCVASTFYISLG